MIEVPEKIKELFRSDNTKKNTHKKFKLVFYDDGFDTLYPYETLFPDEGLFPSEHEEPWLVIENDRIQSESFTLTESLSSENDLNFGSCDSTMVEITVADVIEDVTGREFVLSIEIDGYPMIFGMYTVDSFVRQADRRKRKITAYDRMRKFDTDVSEWYKNLTFPTTVKAFRDSICDYIGITQETAVLPLDSMVVEKTIDPTEISGRDVLVSICQINGCFGHINKMGNLSYIFLQQTGLYPSEDLWPHEELYPSELGGDGIGFENIDYYKSMSYEDYLIDGITGVNIRQEEGDIGASVGDGDNPYAIEGNFLVYGKSALELLNIAQSIYGIIANRIYRPAKIQCYCMPWVEVGDAVRAITRDDMVETFVMKRTIRGCQAMSDSIESTGAKKREESFGISKQIIQLQGKTAVIVKNVDEVSAKVTDLKNYTEAQVKILSDEVSIRVKKGQVSAEISVESDKVTLSGNRLIVNSTNFKLDGSGNAVFSGKLSAASGSFTGTLSGASGDFSGTVHADSGSFNSVTISGCTLKSNSQTGTLSGGTFSGGTISGGTLSSSTGGTYVGTCSGSSIRSCSLNGTSLSTGNGSAHFGSNGSGKSVMYGSRSSALHAGALSANLVTDSGFNVNTRVKIEGSLDVSGTKHRVIKTKNFGERCLSAYETPLPSFSDFGTGRLDEYGECYIAMDPVFAETVNKKFMPVIFLAKYGEGDLWVDKEETRHEIVVVRGTPGLPFAWETRYQQINCYQERIRLLDYSGENVEEHDFALEANVDLEHRSIDYENEANEYLMLHNLQSINYADEGANYFDEFERRLTA